MTINSCTRYLVAIKILLCCTVRPYSRALLFPYQYTGRRVQPVAYDTTWCLPELERHTSKTAAALPTTAGIVFPATSGSSYQGCWVGSPLLLLPAVSQTLTCYCVVARSDCSTAVSGLVGASPSGIFVCMIPCGANDRYDE